MTQEQFEAVCKEVEETDVGLRAIFKKHGVAVRSFYDWLEKDPKHAQRYARAKAAQAELLADSIISIADDSGADFKVIEGVPVMDGESIARARLRVDSRKWIASKLLPKVYGERVHQEVSGEVTHKAVILSKEEYEAI